MRISNSLSDVAVLSAGLLSNASCNMSFLVMDSFYFCLTNIFTLSSVLKDILLNKEL